MHLAFSDRIRKAWNAFVGNDNRVATVDYGPASYGTARPERARSFFYNDRSIVSAIYTRISIDVASIGLRHVELDEQGRYVKDVPSALNECLSLEANIDQAPRAFRQDTALTLFTKGVAAIVPVDTGANPETNENFDIYTLRVGEVTQWHPKHVRVRLWREDRGVHEEITLAKRFVAIVENPLYAVMNEPNSTLQRLTRKLALLDAVDEQSGSGKLDLIIQLPYVVKSDARKKQAEQRRADIEFQLKNSQYGIAYTDGTEKITQLNRPAENNLMKQVEWLTAKLYDELGVTEDIMNGTAAEQTMLNYMNRTVEPVVDAVVEAMQRAFIANPAVGRRSGQRIMYFRDPFKLVPLGEIAEIADKFTRNEIFTSNEIRGFMGVPPSSDPKADKLINSNMPQPNEDKPSGTETSERTSQNGT